MPEAAELKKELRAGYKAVRSSTDTAHRRRADSEIMHRVMSLAQYREAPLILTFVSQDSEVDTLQFIVRALAEGKAVACPRCSREDRSMTFHRITALDQLSAGAYGIFEPEPDAPQVHPEEMDSSICLVPGLSFDASGARLGYGGGYYDRFLARYGGTSIGLCRSECLSGEPLPQDEYDVSVDLVVSDSDLC